MERVVARIVIGLGLLLLLAVGLAAAASFDEIGLRGTPTTDPRFRQLSTRIRRTALAAPGTPGTPPRAIAATAVPAPATPSPVQQR